MIYNIIRKHTVTVQSIATSNITLLYMYNMYIVTVVEVNHGSLKQSWQFKAVMVCIKSPNVANDC